MRKLLEKILAILARKVIKKYQPKIVGITGSVGKTSTREAVYVVVSQKYKTWQSPKNFNELIGLPLSIFGISNYPGKNPLAWLMVLLRGVRLWLLPFAYPKVLVLEMGIDKPGEMEQLVSIAPPHVALLTGVGFSHYEFFKNLATVAEEKFKIASKLSADGVFIYNFDNDTVRQKALNFPNSLSVSSAGLTQADVHVMEITEQLQDKVLTLIKLSAAGTLVEVSVPAVGTAHIAACVMAAAVAHALNIEWGLYCQGMENYRAFPGRLNLIAGIKHSVLIDDTYNAAPDSMQEALALLSRMPQAIKMAALGDMLELGSVSDEEHNRVGRQVAGMELDRLITVGASGRLIASSAIAAGMPEEKVISFASSDEAKMPIQDMLKPGSAVLIKGSQGVRMEKITKELMAEPMRAKDLLCRQYGQWLLS